MRRHVFACGLLFAAACGTSRAQDRSEPADSPAAPAGRPVWSTYYYVASETDHAGAPDTAVRDASCRPIATVSADFYAAACVEGTARLRDGRGINVDEACDCAARCPNGARVCWRELDAARGWGLGSRENALAPFVSWATDRAVIPSGEVVYSAAWDGLAIPAVDGLGGFTHDGCFRADDVGAAIDGDHVDIFVGTRAMWHAMEAIRPTRSRQRAIVGDPRCAHLSP